MRRVLYRLLAGSAAALVAAPGASAFAANPAMRLHFPAISVAGKAPKINALHAWTDVPGTAPAAVGKMTVNVDTADVSDIVTVETFDEYEEYSGAFCDQAGTVITCEINDPVEPVRTCWPRSPWR